MLKKNNFVPISSDNFFNKNEEDLPEVYMPNGAIYIFKVKDFNKENNFPSRKIIPFLMSEIDSIDVDTLSDLTIARKFFLKKIYKIKKT